MSLIPKHELRKIKQRVSKLRKQGHEIFTDEEVEKDGWVLDHPPPSLPGLFVSKEKQRESWDCGLACAQMVLGVLGDTNPSARVLAQRVGGSSVWSIDLAYVLREYGVELQYCTTALTVDESEYSTSAFYAPSLATDAQRVNRLLRAAAAENVDVVERTLSAADLWNLMSEEETLVIALVDARILHKPVCKAIGGARQPSVETTSASKRSPRHANGGKRTVQGAAEEEEAFAGHYVLLLGLDDARGGYVINDPARDDERTFVHADALEAARHAKGTDEDLLLIPAYQEPPVPPRPGSTPKITAVLERADKGEVKEAGERAAAHASSSVE